MAPRQFGTKIVKTDNLAQDGKRTIWYQDKKIGNFGTGQFGTKEKIYLQHSLPTLFSLNSLKKAQKRDKYYYLRLLAKNPLKRYFYIIRHTVPEQKLKT